jgi:hypothetical protein
MIQPRHMLGQRRCRVKFLVAPIFRADVPSNDILVFGVLPVDMCLKFSTGLIPVCPATCCLTSNVLGPFESVGTIPTLVRAVWVGQVTFQLFCRGKSILALWACKALTTSPVWDPFAWGLKLRRCLCCNPSPIVGVISIQPRYIIIKSLTAMPISL